MRRGLLISTVALVLVAGACGAERPGGLRALPRGGGGGGGSSEAATAMLADDTSAGGWHRPVVYEAGDGLGDGLPSSAPAYELVGEPSEGDVRRLAGLLGMSGAVESRHGPDGYYVVKDGELLLEVQRAAGGPWYAHDQRDIAGVATSCAVAVAPDKPVSDGASPAITDDDEVCEDAPAPVTGLLSEEETAQRAREILEGLDLERVTYSIEPGGPSGGPSTSVNVSVAVDGRPVPDLGAWFSFGPDGEVLAAQGWLGELRPIGDYPLAGVDTGIKRLNEGAAGGVAALGAPEPGIAVDTPALDCPPEADCVAPEPGPAPPSPAEEPEPQVVALNEARIGYLVLSGGCAGDPVLLVPAYLFRLAAGQGGEVSVEAVSDEHLQTDRSADDGAGCDDAVEQEPSREPRTGEGGASKGSTGGGSGSGDGEIDPVPAPAPPERQNPEGAESKVATTTQ